MKPLCDLTQVGRGRRLRPVARELLAAYGIEATHLRQVTEASNTIFRVSTRGEDQYALRMTSPKSCHGSDEIRSEVAWLHALEQDTDLGIPAPVPRQDGGYVTEVGVPGHAEPICCAVYRWVPGVMLNDRLTEDNVRRLGSLMAQMHVHAAGFAPPDGFRIRAHDRVFPYADPTFPHVEPVVLFAAGPNAPLSVGRRAVYRAAYEIVAAEVERLMGDESPLQVIHNDLHTWNVKVHGDTLYALDFEDIMWGRPVQDIATTLYYLRWREIYPTYLSAFRSGYESIALWPESHPGQLETLMMGRMLLLANYVAASDDAEDRDVAPEYLVRTGQRLRQFLASRDRALGRSAKDASTPAHGS